MSEPTICIECKHVEPPTPGVFGGRHHCEVVVEKPNFVTGEGRKTKPPCDLKNASGKCPDYAAKEA